MLLFVCRRAASFLLTLAVTSLVVFAVLEWLPGNAAEVILGETATPEALAALEKKLGLDQPAPLRYLAWVGGLLQGRSGLSMAYDVPTAELIAERLQVTLPLAVLALAITVVLALAAGLYAASRQNRAGDVGVMTLTQLGLSVPNFWLAILLVLLFAVKLGWFPIGGYGTVAHVVLPALTLGILGSGWYSRMMRSSMIEVLRADYIRTARAKGLGRARVVFRHALPNAILPVIAMIGIDIGIFMGGIVVVESVFGWPGIGQLAWQAIQQVDIPIIMGVTLVSALAIVIGNLLADLALVAVDPRVSLSSRRE